MKTITTTIKWHNAAEELPEKSCDVVVWSSGYCATLNYSARHRLFNVHDSFTETDARRVAIEVQYWCYKEELQDALCPPKKRKEKTAMTNEDAIKILKVNATLSPKATEFCEAVKIAVAAIERQMPQKPLKRPFDYSELKGKSYYENYDDFLCPSCKKRIISNINGDWVAGRRQKYCDECGQALDWNKAENKKTVFCTDCRYWRKCDSRCDLYGIIVPGPWSCPNGRKGEKE